MYIMTMLNFSNFKYKKLLIFIDEKHIQQQSIFILF